MATEPILQSLTKLSLEGKNQEVRVYEESLQNSWKICYENNLSPKYTYIFILVSMKYLHTYLNH